MAKKITHLGKKTIQVKQQEIRSMIQSFDWETNPTWEMKISQIRDEIKDYWSNYKNA